LKKRAASTLGAGFTVKMKVAFPAKRLYLSTKLHGASAVRSRRREDVCNISRRTCEPPSEERNTHSADSALNFVGKQIPFPAVPSEVPNIIYLFSHSSEKQGVCINWHILGLVHSGEMCFFLCRLC
jgi:hypothetical protein